MLQFGKCLVEGLIFVETCFSGAEAVLGSEEFCERAVDLISDDFFVGDEDVLEDRLVELAPNLVTCAHVERVGVFEQFQVGFEELLSVAEVIDHGGEIGAQSFSLPSDIQQSCSYLPLWQRRVSSKVE